MGASVTQTQRTCVGCRQVDAVKHLVRIVAVNTACQVDEKGNAAGRGAWIHPNSSCLNRAIRTHGFDRAFRKSGLDCEPVSRWLDNKSSGVDAPELTREKESG
ncbi:YlxR family protein [Ancrocorticia populi]|uniref:YlxR family protein n=1 Tax=Ancrocorticia populi TaxID=2175228 RepID=UPI003C6BFF43